MPEPTAPARQLEYVPLDLIEPAERNPKEHDDALIGASVGRFGYIEPAVIDDRTGRLVAGHGRTDELIRRRDAGLPPPDGVLVDPDGTWRVPVIRGWASSTDEEARAAGIALNRVGERGGWNVEELYAELDQLAQSDFGLEGIGYEPLDLDLMRGQLEAIKVSGGGSSSEDPDKPKAYVPVAGTEIPQRGEVWLLGEHRIMCGDSRDPADVAYLLAGERINLGFTSPPYADRRKYDEASGFRPIPPDEYVHWFAPVAANVAEHLADDGSWFVNIKAGVNPNGLDTELYVLDLVIAHVRAWGWHFATEFCWERTGVPKRVSRRFKNTFEPVYQFARSNWKIRPDAVRTPSDAVPQGDPDTSFENYPALQGSGRSAILPRKDGGYTGPMSDAQGTSTEPGAFIGPGLAYPGNRLPTFTSTHEATGHTAAFPVGLPAWFVRAYTDPGDVIYDPFLGSGSTVLAAHQEHRLGRGMELSAGYVDVVCQRWQALTGLQPIREADGEAVDFLSRAPAGEMTGTVAP